MGAMSAMESIKRVIDKHGDEIQKSMMDNVPEDLAGQVIGVSLGNEVYRMETAWLTAAGGHLPGPSVDIDTLAESYPDCEVGY